MGIWVIRNVAIPRVPVTAALDPPDSAFFRRSSGVLQTTGRVTLGLDSPI